MQLAKSLSWVCRHGAVKVGIKMDEGYGMKLTRTANL